MRNLLRILVLCALTVLCGASIYAIIYAGRPGKVVAFIVLALSVLIVFKMVKQWLESGKVEPNDGFSEAEIIDEEKH
jgi:uncharacterized membrane protein (UPF0182 family)